MEILVKNPGDVHWFPERLGIGKEGEFALAAQSKSRLVYTDLLKLNARGIYIWIVLFMRY